MRIGYTRRMIQLVTMILLCIIITPPFTESLVVNRSDSHPLQTSTIWVEMEHDYIRNDVMPYDIAFMNATHGWVLSQNETSFGDGIILHTNDSGYSWYLQHHDAIQWFTQIEIVDETLWVTARQGLLYSIDFGATWNSLSLGSELESFRSIYFFNKTLGWTGSDMGIYKTVDGGALWQKVSSWQFGGNPRGIYFATPQSGWILGSMGIYHTNDGGENLVVRHSRGGWNFFFINPSEAWAVGDYMLAHMVDGATWIEQPLPPDEYSRPPHFRDVYFMNRTHGWIGGLRPQIAHTQNGGVDWYKQSVSVDVAFYAVFLINESHGWAAGRDGHIFRTSKGSELGEFSWSTSTPIDIYTVVVVTIAIGSLVLIQFARRRRRKDSVPSIA